MIPDSYDLWEAKDREETQWLERRPKCDYCREPIQEEYMYHINGEFICENCLERFFRKETEDFME